jgi:hypothetical protein
LLISLSENESSFGAISRLNHALFDVRRRLKKYASLFRSTLQGAERKRLAPDESTPTRQTRRLLIPRPVRVEHLTPWSVAIQMVAEGTIAGRPKSAAA